MEMRPPPSSARELPQGLVAQQAAPPRPLPKLPPSSAVAKRRRQPSDRSPAVPPALGAAGEPVQSPTAPWPVANDAPIPLEVAPAIPGSTAASRNPLADVRKPQKARAQSSPPILREPTQLQGDVPAPEEVQAAPAPLDRSPIPRGSTPVAASPAVASTLRDDGKSEPRSIRRTPKPSERSKRALQRVDYIPAVEYVDTSSMFIRFVQFLILCELSYYLCGVSLSYSHIYLFGEYMKTFSLHTFYAAFAAPIANALAVLFAFRTISGLFAINFTTPTNTLKAKFRLIIFITMRVIFGGVIIVAGLMLRNEIESKESKKVIEKNIAHLIRYATKEHSYMVEINRIQQEFQCCGTKTDIHVGNTTYTSSDHPWNMWFASYSLDETYPNVIRELYSLPWSCCNRTVAVKCEHIGISRYLRSFSNPTDFNDVEAALHVKELDWNPTKFENYQLRNKIARDTLYENDCSDEMFQRSQKEAKFLEQLLFKTGITMIGMSLPLVAVTAHLCLIVSNVKQPAASMASATSKRAIEHPMAASEPRVDQKSLDVENTQPSINL